MFGKLQNMRSQALQAPCVMENGRFLTLPEPLSWSFGRLYGCGYGICDRRIGNPLGADCQSVGHKWAIRWLRMAHLRKLNTCSFCRKHAITLQKTRRWIAH